MRRLCVLLILCFPLLTQGQFYFKPDQTIPVQTLQGDALTLPWAGGLNAAQYNTIDLNGDDQIDLVLFDRMANKPITFINDGNQYRYAPEFEHFFPPLTNWLLLRDFNCDGRKDVFTGDVLGMRVYKNISSGSEPQWEQYLFFIQPGQPKSEVLLTTGFSNNKINLQLQYDDLPSISDVDGDGDLDIMNFRFSGNGTVEFHQNLSIENNGTCDSLEFVRVTQTWGNFTECGCSTVAFNGSPCPTNSGGRTKHAGGKSLLILDLDNDNDQDVLFSESDCTHLYFLENEGDINTPVFTTVREYPSANPAEVIIFPAPFYEDVDFDGTSDLIVTPNVFNREVFEVNLRESNWLYKNTGTTENPSFSFVGENFIQNQMIDVGDNAVPAFADEDGDGDLDLFVGYHNNPTTRNGSVYFYRNIGSASTPAFQFITDDYNNLSSLALYNLKPQFVDINADGRTDLVFTASSLSVNQTQLFYILNQASGRLEFNGQTPNTVNLTVLFSENVHLTDVDLDGKMDVLLGRNTGSVEYWRNNGTAESIDLTKENSTFAGLGSNPERISPSLTTADLNADGRDDLIMGNQYGKLTIVSNFRSQQNTHHENILYNSLSDSYAPTNFGGRIWASAARLFSDSNPVLIVGSILGGVYLLTNDSLPTGGEEPPGQSILKIYPVPAPRDQSLNIYSGEDGTLQWITMTGQELVAPLFIQKNKNIQVSLSSFSPGIYILRFITNGKTHIRRIVIY